MDYPSETLVSISDFASARQQDRGTVNAWIRCHEDVNACCQIIGKDKYIDTSSEGYRLLEKQYPLPRPIEVIEDKESRAALIQAQQLIIRLQEQLKEQAIQIAEQKSVQLLLEDREKQLAEQKEQAKEQKELFQTMQEKSEKDLVAAENREKEAREQADQERIRAEEAEKKLAELEAEKAAAEEQVEKMKNAGFWARLRKKW